MKKIMFLINLAIISADVFGVDNDHEDLIKLYRTDSPRFQLEMMDISEYQTICAQTHNSQIHDGESNTYQKNDSVQTVEKSNLNLNSKEHKRKKRISSGNNNSVSFSGYRQN